jgi:tetratricopeptide (TPR) repeat protein
VYCRTLVFAALMVAGGLFAPASATDSDLCRDGNNIASSGIAACTRIISAGVAKGRDLADAYYERGLKHKLNERYDQAINDLSTAIKVDPSWSWPYVARGHVYAIKRDFTRAFADQETAVRLEPTAVTYVGRAQDLIEAGAFDRAIADLDQALRLNPKYFFAFFTRGDVYVKKREFAKAIDDYNTALQIGSTSEISMNYVRTQLKRARDQLGQ